MRILIDAKSLQATHHRRDDQRLCTLLSVLRRRHTVDFSTRAGLTGDGLTRYHVLVIATRYPESERYTAEELDAVREFVSDGAGLILMTNHADWPGHNPNDTRAYDAELAEIFGVTIERTFFRNRLDNVPTVLADRSLEKEHPIISGASEEERVSAVLTNTCSSIRCEQGQPLVSLSEGMVDRRTGKATQPGQLFAHALDMNETDSDGNGRIVTIADSGFIGSRWTEVPGPGLIRWADNPQFIRNAIRWAGREI
jgi:hypothetical protein